MISISLHPLLFKTSKNQFSASYIPNLHWHILTSLDSTDFSGISNFIDGIPEFRGT